MTFAFLLLFRLHPFVGFSLVQVFRQWFYLNIKCKYQLKTRALHSLSVAATLLVKVVFSFISLACLLTLSPLHKCMSNN